MNYYDGWPKRHKKEIVFDEPLIMSEYQRRSAINKKAAFLALVHPVDFIKATIPDIEYVNKLVDESYPLSHYNILHRKGKINYPYLEVNLKSKEIIGHDGRHRMFSIFADNTWDNRQKVPVFFMAGHRIKDRKELSFPMDLKYQFYDFSYITIRKNDVLEIYDKEHWLGY